MLKLALIKIHQMLRLLSVQGLLLSIAVNILLVMLSSWYFRYWYCL